LDTGGEIISYSITELKVEFSVLFYTGGGSQKDFQSLFDAFVKKLNNSYYIVPTANIAMKEEQDYYDICEQEGEIN